jgi:hypothetical protein
MSDYTGGLNNNVFAYLDSIQQPPEPKRTLIEHKYESEHAMMSDALRQLTGILRNDLPDKRSQINELNKRLTEKYPRYNWGYRPDFKQAAAHDV